MILLRRRYRCLRPQWRGGPTDVGREKAVARSLATCSLALRTSVLGHVALHTHTYSKRGEGESPTSGGGAEGGGGAEVEAGGQVGL